MKKYLKLLFFVCLTAIPQSCDYYGGQEQKTVIGHTARCYVEYVDNNGDGINDSANVTLSITLNDNSTANYTSTVVYWDDRQVLSTGGLPVKYTQNVELSKDADHKFSFQCERYGTGGNVNKGAGSLPVIVENGEVSADFIVSGNSGTSIK